MTQRKATQHKMFRRWCILRTWIRNATPTKYKAYYGVKMHPAWDNDFWAFAEYIDSHWDVSNITSADIFDRIDNTKPYKPGNVRFTDSKGNCRDRATTHYITYGKCTKSIADWAETTGIDYSCLLSRSYAGWEPKKILRNNRYGRK